MMLWVEPLFGPERRLAYRMTFNGRHFGDQWTVPVGEVTPGVFAFDLFLELDLSVLGAGGSVRRGRARLECTAAFEPVRYVSEMLGARLEVRFDRDQIHVQLPDGSTIDVPRADARHVAEANYIGLDALMLAHARATGQLGPTCELRLFLVNSAATMPYRLEALDRDAGAGARWYRTTMDEEVLVDAVGLGAVHHVTSGVRVERAVPPTPLPAWEIPPIGEPARYVVPADARFRLEDVRIPGPVVEIGATVTVPDGPPPYPAVVFIGGSGVHDRHGISGELDGGAHEIVDHLSEHGLLGVRFDSRGAGATRIGADVLVGGLESIIADARAVVAWTLARNDVDRDRLFLVGHSQGGTVAMALVARHGVRAAGLVLLATLGRSIEAVSRDQILEGGRLFGFDREQLALQLERQGELFALIRAGVPWTEDHVPAVHLAAAPLVPWLREYAHHDPQELAAEIRCPTLILYGSADFQVNPEADGQPLAAAVRGAGADVTVETLRDLDHLFKPAPAGNSTLASYYAKDRRVDPGFLRTLTDWFAEQRCGGT